MKKRKKKESSDISEDEDITALPPGADACLVRALRVSDPRIPCSVFGFLTIEI